LLAAVAIFAGFVVCIATTYSYAAYATSLELPQLYMVGAIVAGIVVSLLLGSLLRALGGFAPVWVRFLLPLLVIPVVVALSISGLASRFADLVGLGTVGDSLIVRMFENAVIGGAVFSAFFSQALTRKQGCLNVGGSRTPGRHGLT